MYNFTIKSFRKLLPFMFEYDEYATYAQNETDYREEVAQYFEVAHNSISSLTDDEVRIIKLRFLLGYSRAEIAEEESISIDVASKRLTRAETKFYNTFLNQIVK